MEMTKVVSGKRNRLRAIGLNILVWMPTIFLLSYGIWKSDQTDQSLGIMFVQGLVGVSLLLIPVAYANTLVLIPRFLLKKRYWQYALTCILLAFFWAPLPVYLGNLIDTYFFNTPIEELDNPLDIRVGFVMLAVIVVSTLINMTYRSIKKQGKASEIENERLTTELSLLRNQISPHFFFNTLNNLYALSLEESKETPKVILKLSEMMRYTIYECNGTHVAVSKEIKYLENYIALQQIRHHKKATIEFLKSLEDTEVEICPMILIVFLENAFKHGVDGAEGDAFVKLELETTHNMLRFRIENSIAPVRSLDKPGGIGLENARKRLELIYGKKYSLKETDADGIFCVDLTIDLT